MHADTTKISGHGENRSKKRMEDTKLRTDSLSVTTGRMRNPTVLTVSGDFPKVSIGCHPYECFSDDLPDLF